MPINKCLWFFTSSKEVGEGSLEIGETLWPVEAGVNIMISRDFHWLKKILSFFSSGVFTKKKHKIVNYVVMC
jgi:hypothetical protein